MPLPPPPPTPRTLRQRKGLTGIKNRGRVRLRELFVKEFEEVVQMGFHNSLLSKSSLRNARYAGLPVQCCWSQLEVVVYESCRRDSLHSTVEPCPTDPHIKRPVSFVPTKCSCVLSKINPLLKYEHYLIRTTDTILCPESDVINR